MAKNRINTLPENIQDYKLSNSHSVNQSVLTSGNEAKENLASTTLSKVLTGSFIYSIWNWLYDYPFYSFVIWYLGIFKGGLIMAILSLAVDLATLKFYDWSKEDWFALEYIKALKDYKGKNIIKNFFAYVMLSTPLVVQVIVLSTKFNSFMVTALLREGAYKYQGFSTRDWMIFGGSYIFSQIYWILIISGGVNVLEQLIKITF